MPTSAAVAAASRLVPLTVTAVTERLQLLDGVARVNVVRARTSGDPATPAVKNLVGKRAFEKVPLRVAWQADERDASQQRGLKQVPRPAWNERTHENP